MKRLRLLAIVAILVLGVAAAARAETEVKMTGDALIYGVYASQRNFTGWSNSSWGYSPSTGLFGVSGPSATEDKFQIWERFRVRADFTASEAVKFRLGLRVQDTWGHGTYTAANPSAGITSDSGLATSSGVQVYLAYLQFKVPDTEIEVTAGLQEFSLPTSSFFCDSVVWGGTRAAALIVNAPIVDDTLSVVTGFSRMIDANQTFDTSSSALRHKADELDLYFLTLPITGNGFKATPWGALAVAGRDADYYNTYSYGWYPSSAMGEDLMSAGSVLRGAQQGSTHGLWKNSQNLYYWAGSAFEVTLLDPVKFYADVIYGAGAMNDRNSSKRQGWFIDFGAEYTGMDFMTPQIFAWWSTGEDKSTGNGSERMPTVVPNWGPGNSFLFDCSQEFTIDSNMGVNPVGAYGAGASLNNISFIEKLTQRLTFTYLRGNNSPRAIRYLNLTLGDNPYFMMGRDLTTNEQLFSINLDSTYKIYENLSAIVETGWAHGDFQESVWGHRWVKKSNDGDAWKVAFGLKYTF